MFCFKRMEPGCVHLPDCSGCLATACNSLFQFTVGCEWCDWVWLMRNDVLRLDSTRLGFVSFALVWLLRVHAPQIRIDTELPNYHWPRDLWHRPHRTHITQHSKAPWIPSIALCKFLHFPMMPSDYRCNMFVLMEFVARFARIFYNAA